MTDILICDVCAYAYRYLHYKRHAPAETHE